MKPFTSLSSLAAAALLSALPALSQSNLPTNLNAPPGWSKTLTNGNLVFAQPGTRSRIIVKGLSPLNGDLRAWFARQLSLDARARGALQSSGPLQAQGPALTQLRNFNGANGAQIVIYVGYPVGSKGRLMVATGDSREAIVKATQEANALGAKLGALDSATAKRLAASGGQTKTSIAKTSGGTTQAKLSPVRAKGTLKSAQILGVYLNEGYTTGVGGMMIVEYTPVLLLRDGSARRDLEMPPLDLNLKSDKARHAKDWGRWQKRGANFMVRWSDGETDELRASGKTRAARPGQTLSRSYRTIGGGGNTAMGGDMIVSYSNQYNFARNGTFTTDSGSGGGNSSVTAYSTSKNAGRYRLDGNALTLRFNDGRTVRRFFYFYDQDNDKVIGLDDSAYIGDK